MQITINGKPVEVTEGITIAQLLDEQEVTNRALVTVGMDDEIYEQDQHPATVVPAGAAIELLYFMGGGAQ